MHGPAVNPPREQGVVERAGARLQHTLPEVCKSSLERGDEFVPVACWIGVKLAYPDLPGYMTPFCLLFFRNRRTGRDTVLPLLAS